MGQETLNTTNQPPSSKDGALKMPTGTEKFPILPSAAELLNKLNLGTDLSDFLAFKNHLPEKILTGPAINIARSGENQVDIIKGGRRFIVYPQNEQDQTFYKLLKEFHIPQFDRLAYDTNPEITIVKIPIGAWRLDSTDFPEEEPTLPEGTGAMEIMQQLGSLLNNLRKKSGMLPIDFKLCKTAFVTGSKDFIQLIPPYSFSENILPDDIVERVRQDLYYIDPLNPHEKQLKAFSTALFNEK